MSATIKSRTVSSIVDNRLRLSASGVARALSIGTNWTKIRIGLRLQFADTGGNLTGTPRFFLGVCSGTTNIYGDASATNACGVESRNTTWTRGTDGTRAWYGISDYLYPAKQVGATVTYGATPITGNPGQYFGATVGDIWRDVHFVDIQKGSPNYSFWVFWNNNLSDWTSAQFMTQMEAATPSFSSHFYTGPQTLAVDEVAGSFDTACIYWDHSDAPLEASDFAVARLA